MYPYTNVEIAGETTNLTSIPGRPQNSEQRRTNTWEKMIDLDQNVH